MSINDLLDNEMLLPTMMIFFVIIMLIAVPVGLSMRNKTNKSIYGDDESGETREERNARIIATKRTPHPLNQTVMINMVVFEFTDGNRVELAVKDPTIYGIMVEGDCGTLKYQGKKFLNFERNT